MQNKTFQYVSIFIIGLILGFSINNIDLSTFSASINNADSAKSEAENILVAIGDDNAPIKITEYSDFECPLCKKYFDGNFEELKTKYVDTGKAQYIFKQFPLKSIHPKAQKAGEASLCAHDQGKFWEMHKALFEKQREWATSNDYLTKFTAYAVELGADEQKFNDCLTSGKYQSDVQKDYQEGVSSGVSGTPTVFINDTKIVGAQAVEKHIEEIEKQLNAA